MTLLPKTLVIGIMYLIHGFLILMQMIYGIQKDSSINWHGNDWQLFSGQLLS